ncbi:MAG: PorV/PorQ family protein [Candidatus Zixiibacteriota bacterium]
MLTKKLSLSLIALGLVFIVPANSFAVSEAAVLFLRIAPGARAAGMGEAFVAVADDATATHFNPAGLGAYPLSEDWIEVKVPPHLRPLRAIAPLKLENGRDYRAYDIWAITAQGLVRYDHRQWHSGEIFSTKTDQTVLKIVKSYFNVGDEERLAQMVATVAQANNAKSLSYLEKLYDSVMAVIPEDYSQRESLMHGFDSLLSAFELCLINWEKVKKIEKLLAEGMKDGTLTETECDRINFAVERSKNRFIPEEIVIPYSTLVGTNITAIASTEKSLLVGTPNGLFAFNGSRWLTLTDAEDLPSSNILCLSAVPPDNIYIGTDRGIARFAGLQVRPVAGSEQLPEGPVEAIGASSENNIWIALNNDLYHWDGQAWSNNFAYTVTLDDTPVRIAERFAVYGTEKEKEKYLAKFHEMNQNLSVLDSETVNRPTPVDSGQMTAEEDSTLAEEATGADDQPASSGGLSPGMVVRAPYLAEIKGRVNTIHAGFDKVWLGTEYGVMLFDHEQWQLPGYRVHEVENGETVNDLVEVKNHRDFVSALRYAVTICDLNDLPHDLDQPLPDGQKVKIYRNPAAASVNRIKGRAQQVYFATTDGIIEFDGRSWRRVEKEGLDRAYGVDAEYLEEGLWLVSSEEIVIKTNGRSEASFMHAKWLPELADDLYYSFLSFTAKAGSWGTFGGNVTFISYGRFVKTVMDPTPVDEWDAYDIALTGSYGTPLTSKLKGGISAKVIHSRLSPKFGAGKEVGKGTSTGFAVDFGLLYEATPRLNWGLAVTNIGPKMAYIDAAQADPLPTNLGFGFAYKLLRSDYYTLLVAAEVNKEVADLNDGFREELKQVVLNGGTEFLYANTIAFRAGYIHDEEGKLKTATAGVGLYLFNTVRFDFAYYFGSDVNEARKGIKPLTVTLVIR